MSVSTSSIVFKCWLNIGKFRDMADDGWRYFKDFKKPDSKYLLAEFMQDMLDIAVRSSGEW
jgi:hypothetical protein